MEPEDYDDSPGAWQTYDVEDDGNGGAYVYAQTNDNNDDGYPDPEGVESWRLHFKRVEDALRHAGKSRTGISGVKVTVTYKGEVI